MTIEHNPSDHEKLVEALRQLLINCFSDAPLEFDGSLREVSFYTYSGEHRKGTLGLHSRGIPLLFQNRRSIQGVTPKQLRGIYLRGQTILEPCWTVQELLSKAKEVIEPFDDKFSCVVFASEGTMWINIQAMVTDSAGARQAVVVSFNTNELPVKPETVKVSKKKIKT